MTFTPVTFTYETRDGKVTGLTRAEAAMMLWENHRDCYLKDGCDSHIMENALNVLSETPYVSVGASPNPLIVDEIARVHPEA